MNLLGQRLPLDTPLGRAMAAVRQTLAWVATYFGPIPPGPDVPDLCRLRHLVPVDEGIGHRHHPDRADVAGPGNRHHLAGRLPAGG